MCCAVGAGVVQMASGAGFACKTDRFNYCSWVCLGFEVCAEGKQVSWTIEGTNGVDWFVHRDASVAPAT